MFWQWPFSAEKWKPAYKASEASITVAATVAVSTAAAAAAAAGAAAAADVSVAAAVAVSVASTAAAIIQHRCCYLLPLICDCCCSQCSLTTATL